MGENEKLNRREFTAASVMALLSGVTIGVSSCGGSGSPTTPTVDTGGVTASIDTNHGHSGRITSAQITAGGDVELDITGTSNHPHTVSLTAAQVMAIGAGTRVSVESTNNAGHSHTVTFN